MAAFLIVEGFTGSLLAFNSQLERLVSPQLFAQPKPGAARLSLGAQAEKAAAMIPGGQVDYLMAYPNQTMVRVEARPNAAPLGFDQMFLDPWTGRELGRRRFGDLREGAINLMPFVYDVHSELAAGPTGELVLGIVALVWTIDCFVSFYVTLPTVLPGFWKRWRLAWRVKPNVGAFRLNFDLHRASGLWLWPLLLIFAWSSVMLALPSVYERVTGALFDLQTDESLMTFPAHSAKPPKLDWVAAERVGERLMAQQAALHRISVEPADTLAYIGEESVYSYGARSSLDVRGTTSDTGVWYDADTGALRHVFLPRGQHAGNTIGTWLWALHFADLADSLVYRIVVAVTGGVIVMLSATGIYIWLKKRRVRRRQPPATLPSA